MLEVNGVHTYYGDSHVLHGVSLRVGAGDAAAVLGRNGMGKTTLIRTIVGLQPPRSGRVVFRGREIQGMEAWRVARLGVGLVPQGRRIFPSLTVEENLRVAARGAAPWSLAGVYGLFPRLRERRSNRGNQLSGGEQQMLAIGRALMTNPSLLLLDEPSEGLAPLLVREVADAIVRLRDEGQGVLLVEQNLSVAQRVANRAYVLSRGRVVFEGTPQALWDDAGLRTQHLGV
jgi:branched-chain amino acid transport system ATP-binding protein